jgi:hypothetical protein
MDGISWGFGETKVHYLILSVLVGNVAVPIYWVQLEKIGAFSQEERKTMFEQVFKLFNLERMHINDNTINALFTTFSDAW